VRHHRRERWLHTRISEHLEDALKQEARRRRLPVSMLVRDVLEGALDLVENIVESSLHVARRSERTARHVRRRDGLDEVYGWQDIILNRAASCARCDTSLAVGTGAYRGLREGAGPPAFLCSTCVRRLRATPTSEKEESR